MRILAAMSGGVDSSVTAALLVDRGHDVIGVTMSLWEPEGPGHAKRCCGAEEAYGAKAVCDVIGIPHYTFDMHAEFRRHVVDDFIAEYARGRTPNPCVRCNQFLKFDVLMEKARLLGCDAVATGHYARIAQEGGRHYLQKGDDENKDQSYFLYPIREPDLPKILFPLADLEKPEVRRIAESHALPTAQKAESQDVCFIPGDHVKFLEKVGGVASAPGEIRHEDGRVLGRHEGLHRYTVGQRRGIGLAHETPLYVKSLDMTNNTLVVGSDSSLFGRSFSVPEVNVLASDLWKDGEEYGVKVRYRTAPKRGILRMTDGVARVELLEDERGITSGQSAVFYRGRTVVAGGILEAEAG